MRSNPQEFIQHLIGSVIVKSNRPDWYVENGYGTMDMGLDDRFEIFLHAIKQAHDVHCDDFKGIDLKHMVLFTIPPL